jgi:hypothetical protein
MPDAQCRLIYLGSNSNDGYMGQEEEKMNEIPYD